MTAAGTAVQARLQEQLRDLDLDDGRSKSVLVDRLWAAASADAQQVPPPPPPPGVPTRVCALSGSSACFEGPATCEMVLHLVCLSGINAPSPLRPTSTNFTHSQ